MMLRQKILLQWFTTGFFVAGGLVLSWFLAVNLKHKEPYSENLPNKLFLFAHILGGSLAIAVAPFLFLRISRNQKFIKIHRWLGRIYVLAIIVACLAGLYVTQFVMLGGAWSRAAFVCQFIVWSAATMMAFVSVRNQRIAQHRIWMIRSFAVTLSFATHAFWVTVFRQAAIGQDFNVETGNVAGDWLTWILNLAVAELIIQLPCIKRRRASYWMRGE